MRTIIFAFICALFTLSSLSDVQARRGSYRKNRKHKGLKYKKKEYKIEKSKRRKKKVVKQKKRRPMAIGAFQRYTKIRILQRLKGQIQTLNQIISQTPQRLRGDLYFRLAEHYWEVAKYYDFVGHKYDDYRGRPEWPEKKRLQAQAWVTAKEYRKKAAAQYFKIIRGYPNFNRLCEAYYFLGKNLFDMGREKPALQVFRTMIQKFASSYPKCPFIPNAYLAFGEHYFNNNQVRTALGSYQQVLHFRTSTIYAFALYKVAWCYYNLVRYRLALRKFIEVVQHARRASGRWGSNARRLQLLKEALRDLVLAYSQVGEARQAKNNFFTWGGEGNYLKMMSGLGGLYREQGKNDKIIYLYSQLMQIQSGSPKTMLYQLYIAQAVDRVRSKKETIQAVFKLVKLVKHFRKINPKSAIYKQAIQEIQPQIKEFATFRHYEGQRTRRPHYLTEAMEFYRAYLMLFPRGKDALKMRFFFAELLFKRKKYEQAAAQYTKVLKLNPKSKYALDSGYNPVLAYHRLMKKRGLDVTNVGSKRGQSTSKRPLPPIAKRFLTACETFLKYFSKGTRAIDVSYKAAQLYYFFNHYDKALPRFYFLVKKFPKHEYAIYAAHYILDVYNVQEKWIELNKWAWRFYKMPGLGDAKFKREVRDFIVHSGMKTCERIDNAKKYLEAASCYNKFATEFPDNKRLAPTALFNASINYYKAKQAEKALHVRRKLLSRFPKSKYVKRTILDLGTVYADRANFGESARYYEMYVTRYKKDKKRSGKPQSTYYDALTRAARFREANGENEKSIDHYKKLIGDENFRKRHTSEFVRLYMHIAKYYKKRGNLSRYGRMMRSSYDHKDRKGKKIRRYFPAGLKIHARMEHALAEQKLGRRRKAEKIYTGVPRAYDRLSEVAKKKYYQAAYAAANVRFLNAEKLFREYAKIRLSNRMNKKQMGKTLRKKDKALNKAWKAYGKVIKYRQGHWGVAAYYRAGDISLNYSKFLYNAPIPSKASIRKQAIRHIRKLLYQRRVPGRFHARVLRSPQMRQTILDLVEKISQNFRDALQRRSEPYEKKAVEFYTKALGMAHRLSVYNKWTKKTLARLATLRPYDFPKHLESISSSPFSSSDFTFSKKIMGELKAAPTPLPPARSKTPQVPQPPK